MLSVPPSLHHGVLNPQISMLPYSPWCSACSTGRCTAVAQRPISIFLNTGHCDLRKLLLLFHRLSYTHPACIPKATLETRAVPAFWAALSRCRMAAAAGDDDTLEQHLLAALQVQKHVCTAFTRVMS